MKKYLVGGAIRDEILGINSNDHDYVLDVSTYAELKTYVLNNSTRIFLEKPEFGTIRYLSLDEKPEDISLPIKSRCMTSQHIQIGSILEDLKNRDFTINAMAKEIETSELIDPYNGQEDLKNRTLRCVQTPEITIANDPIRILRAIRFSMRFSLDMDPNLIEYINSNGPGLISTCNRERIIQELNKSLEIDSEKTLFALSSFTQGLTLALFKNTGIRLKAISK